VTRVAWHLAGKFPHANIARRHKPPKLITEIAHPACILAAVLHFLPATEADAVAAAFRRAVAPGSYLIVSSGTSTGTSPALIERLQAVYQDSAVVTGRTVDEIAGYLADWDLLPPGLTDVWAWRPDSEWYWPPPPSARILGAVARKPATPGDSNGPPARPARQ